MTQLRYPKDAIVGDYFRTAAGLGVGLAVLLFVPLSTVIILVFGGLTVIFLVFGLRTVQRQLMQVAVTDEKIDCRSFTAKSLAWSELDRLKLRFYGTRRQAREGGGASFMQLTLKGAGTAMTFESSLLGFDWITWRAARAARDRGLDLDSASANNLLNLGIDADSAPPPLPR